MESSLDDDVNDNDSALVVLSSDLISELFSFNAFVLSETSIASAVLLAVVIRVEFLMEWSIIVGFGDVDLSLSYLLEEMAFRILSVGS